MSFIKFFISLSCTLALILALNKTWIIEDSAKKKTQIPRLGYFLSPSTGFWQNAEGDVPDLPTTLSFEALSAPVRVYYDDRLVPHIFAQNTKDAYFAQGYITASLRLWQMEFQTYAAAGRLAEIIGNTIPDVVKLDKQMRHLGLPRAAHKAVDLWAIDKEMFANMQSYTDGVNLYINSLSSSELPLEYKLMDYKPEAWSVYKIALLLKYMALDLTGRDDDFNFSNALKLLGAPLFDRLYPEYFPEQSPIIPDTFWRFAPTNPLLRRDTVRPLLSSGMLHNPYPQPPKGIGSNNWAISARKTANGKPILCNDPHLRLTLPSIWFEVQLHTPEYNVYGASLPGAPAVISGFNEFVAWGVTNVGHDVQDWFRVRWKDASRKEYKVDSIYMNASHVYDTIYVRDGKPVIDTLIYTHWGIIAHSENGEDYALRWTAHDASLEPLAFLGLNKAKNYEDYRNAIQYYSCPAQNIAFAAINGDIAMTVQGKLPIRKFRQGKFVQDGATNANTWTESIPNDQLPSELNPARGFVASANQHSTQPTYPYYYHGYFEDHRGRYLNQRLASMNNITVDSMMRLQNDNYSVRGRDFLPLLLKYLRRGGLDKQYLELLAKVDKWDYIYDKDAIAPVIFNAWMDELVKYTFDEITKYNIDNKLDSKHEIKYPEEWTLLSLLKRDTLNPIIDWMATGDKRETIQDVVTESFKQAYNTLGGYENLPNWRTKKASRVQHLARIASFSYENIDNGGHGSALNAMTSTNGGSWRMIVELGGKAYGVYPGGQSGNVGSRFYASMLDKWTKGEYYELLFMKKEDDFADKMIFQQEFN